MIEKLKQNLLAASDQDAARIERRQSPRRRIQRDRRKGIQRTVGLDISPSGIALAIIEHADESPSKEKLIVERKAFPVDSGPRNGDWDDGTLTETLTELASTYNLGGQAAVVAIGGHQCVTRVVAGDNEEVDGEINELIGRTQRYIGMGLGEKVSCENTHRIDARRKRVSVTIAMREMVDAIASAIQAAGMRLAYLEHTMLVLCRILNAYEADSEQPILFIVDEMGRVDIGISYEGRLLLDYRPAMPESSAAGRDIVQRHLRSLRRYIQAQLPTVDTDLSKIFVTGDKISSNSLYLRNGSRSKLHRCHFPLFELCGGLEVHGDVTEDAGTIAAIGLAKLTRDNVAADDHNDLASTLRTDRRVRWLPVLRQAWPIALAASIALILFWMGSSSHQLAEHTQTQIEELTARNMQGNELRLKLKRTMQRAEQVDDLRTKMVRPKWANVLVSAGKSLPAGTWLDSIRVDRNASVNLSGAGHAADAVYEYIDRLRRSGSFSRVALESTSTVQGSSGPEYRFELSATFQNSMTIEPNSNLTFSPTLRSSPALRSAGGSVAASSPQQAEINRTRRQDDVPQTGSFATGLLSTGEPNRG